VLQLAVERRIVVVPFGGGTSVVGGVEPEEPPGTHGVIALDLQRLDRVLAVDPVSHTAIVEAGIYGPALEQALNAQGYTLGHFPQSFEFSTVGGWIAARSAGQKSSRYGKIENMVVALELVTPQGLASTAGVPASAAGPSLKQLYIGSEGTLGVIVQATLRIHPLPEAESHAGILFKTFADGTEAVRAIAQSELRPIMLRLTDEDETAASSAMRRLPPSRLKQLIEQAGLAAVRPLGYALEQGSLLLASFEGSRAMVARERREALAICRRHGGFGLGAGPVHSWARERFTTPYLRDTLLDHGLLVETMETATLWDTLPALHRALKTAIAETIEQGGVRGLVMAHISHVYPEGASLYFTFLAPQAAGAELAQWQAIKRAALDAIVSHGGTISHHHGVGRDHRAWLGREIGAQGLAALRALKRELDPNGVMNPGKLGL
jgi:alkyldihydroxyacetonephosphate synthase